MADLAEVDWNQYGPLMTPGEVAALFRVDTKSVARWGRLAAVRTPGGHRRYKREDVRALLEDDAQQQIDDEVRERARPRADREE